MIYFIVFIFGVSCGMVLMSFLIQTQLKKYGWRHFFNKHINQHGRSELNNKDIL
jgi:hypothetical protein